MLTQQKPNYKPIVLLALLSFFFCTSAHATDPDWCAYLLSPHIYDHEILDKFFSPNATDQGREMVVKNLSEVGRQTLLAKLIDLGERSRNPLKLPKLEIAIIWTGHVLAKSRMGMTEREHALFTDTVRFLLSISQMPTETWTPLRAKIYLMSTQEELAERLRYVWVPEANPVSIQEVRLWGVQAIRRIVENQNLRKFNEMYFLAKQLALSLNGNRFTKPDSPTVQMEAIRGLGSLLSGPYLRIYLGKEREQVRVELLRASMNPAFSSRVRLEAWREIRKHKI